MIRILSFLAMMAVTTVCAAQQYPNKPIRIISPNAPGGALTVLGQLIGQKLTESWGQNVLLENRPGGNTVIGSGAVSKAPPDGYTLLVMSSSHMIVPQLLTAPYHAINDFTPIATISSTEQLLIAHPSLPANSLGELIALAKAKPGGLNVAVSGGGSVTHLGGELFNIMADIKTQHVAYKGGGPALIDLMGGQVHIMFITPPAAMPHLKSGKIKAIAVSGDKRLAQLPQVATFAQGGLPNYDVKAWFGVLAPPKTPRPIVDRLSNEIARILGQADVKEKLAGLGMDPFISTPEQFLALMEADYAKYGKVIKAANIKLNQ